MKSIFAFCLVLGLVFSANSVFSLTTTTETYAQSVDGAHVVSAGGAAARTYGWVDIRCETTLCSLHCQGPGYLACTWDNAAWCANCEGDMFEAGNGQDMFDYAIAQIDASVSSGTYVNNILPLSGPHYFRSITWSYNSVADQYNMILTLTEVSP